MAIILSRQSIQAAMALALVATALPLCGAEAQPADSWQLGAPIVTYWAGPAMTDKVAEQMAAGGWNLVWCRNEEELDVAHRRGLRAQFQHGLISPKSLDDPARKTQLDALIERVAKHPALYSYYIKDEPSAADFAALGRLVDYLRQRDPAHLAYINLFPTYANNEQLGTTGQTVPAYREHLRQYVDVVKPALISYDNYRFAVSGDLDEYFLNLAMIRQAGLDAKLPFLNIVQASSWHPSMRVPTDDEMRYLVYTTLAYGGQGISYYVYCCPDHDGGIALADGTPTPLYEALKTLNPEFAAIAAELQPLRSLAVYHAGMTPQGTVPLPADSPFRLDPPVASMPYEDLAPVKGIVLGLFGPAPQEQQPAEPTHAVVVNLDYKADVSTALIGPDNANLEVFDAAARTWCSAGGSRVALNLPRGGGKLLRIARH